MAGYYYGVDLGGTFIKFGLFSEKHELIETFIVDTPKENHNETILKEIHNRIISHMHKNNIVADDIKGIGIAIPCPVKNGIVIVSANIKFTENKNVRQELENLFNGEIKIRVGNDASLAAYGEYKVMNSPHKNVCFYTLGTGIGGGIIINGRLLEGDRGGVGEFGHMQMIEDYPFICGCGKSGCLEQLSGTDGMVSYCKELLEKHDSILKNKVIIMPKDIFDAAKEGDFVAGEVVDRVTHYIALSAVNISTILDPDIYIIGGGISKAGMFLIDKIQEKYRLYARLSTGEIPFALAKLGNEAGIYGASYLVDETD